jgi:RNA polymerase sigma factor (sigma-70 family)
MTSSSIGDVLQYLRRLVTASEASDQELLQRFCAGRDEAAFAALVCRHGPMVLGVCRRVLSNTQDAEDAFQATFLLLVKKAGSLDRPERLGNWLYGVAQRTALKLRGQNTRRSRQERPLADVAAREEVANLDWQELRPMLDEELQRLPENYRVPVVLCCLEGVSKRAAARQLGWPEGTLSTRLHHARRVLRERLRRRGLTLSAGFAVALSEGIAPAAVSASLTTATVTAASLMAAGGAMSDLPAAVAALTEGVERAMSMSKLKLVSTALLAIGFLALGISGAVACLGVGPQGGNEADTAARPAPAAAQPPAPGVPVIDPDEKTAKPPPDNSTNHGMAPFVGLFRIQKLATNQTVQEDLKLTKDKARTIKNAFDKIQADNKDELVKLRKRRTSEEDRAAFEKKLHEAYLKVVTDVLDADQMKRLRQIARNVQGIEAFQLAEVQAALKLTKEQKSKLKAIKDKAEKEIHDLCVADEQDNSKFAAVVQAAMTATMRTLTEDQRKVFQDLIGKPFRFK